MTLKARRNKELVSEADFQELADAICNPAANVGCTLLSVHAETSDFVRFNGNQVRQATRVSQYQATLSLVSKTRRVSSSITLGPDNTENIAALKREYQALAKDLPLVPDDPYLLLPEAVQNSSRTDPPTASPATAEVIEQIMNAANDTDMVGFYASGPGIVAFGDSRGQRNWHRVESFHFDWSLYLGIAGATDRAVKSAYAGTRWDSSELVRRMGVAREQLEPLGRPIQTIKPGSYRAYITPAAVSELLGGLAWSGFSRKDRNSGTSSLCQLVENRVAMHGSVNMMESTAAGLAPGFTDSGFIRPDTVSLIAGGKATGSLVSPRSAAEFDEPANSDASEHPQSLALMGGELRAADVLGKLDTGVLIANLWYLNYSDRPNCRMTGMTRFASFWVENGKIVAPIAPIRFDDSLIRLFGSCLIDLTVETEFMPDPSTWGARHMSSYTSPGLLVKDMVFTL